MSITDPLIRFHKVAKSYGHHRALRDVTFTAGQGELVYVAGPSGAGKTTLLRLINHEVAVDSGGLWVAGRALHNLRRGELSGLRREVGVVYQDYGLLSSMTALENVEFAYRVCHVWQPSRMARSRALMALAAVGLEDRAGAFPRHLSGGEQQRVAIARAVVSQPAVLLADEPTGNLDRESSLNVITLLESVAAGGTTVLVATHDAQILRPGRRVLRIDAGRLAEEQLSKARAS